MLATNTNYDQRVAAGKVNEKIILETLRSLGYVVTDATPDEDMRRKIDGWILWENVKKSLQVKFRESGDDILFEAVKDVSNGTLGRDMLGEAELYLVVNTDGTGKMVEVSEIKDLAKIIIRGVLAAYNNGSTRRTWGNQNSVCSAVIRSDPAHGNEKLIIFVKPDKLNVLGEWKFNLKTS